MFFNDRAVVFAMNLIQFPILFNHKSAPSIDRATDPSCGVSFQPLSWSKMGEEEPTEEPTVEEGEEEMQDEPAPEIPPCKISFNVCKKGFIMRNRI